MSDRRFEIVVIEAAGQVWRSETPSTSSDHIASTEREGDQNGPVRPPRDRPPTTARDTSPWLGAGLEWGSYRD